MHALLVLRNLVLDEVGIELVTAHVLQLGSANYPPITQRSDQCSLGSRHRRELLTDMELLERRINGRGG